MEEPPRDPPKTIWRIQRYQSIQERQARGVRERFLISGFTQGTINGAYISVASSLQRLCERHRPSTDRQTEKAVVLNLASGPEPCRPL